MNEVRGSFIALCCLASTWAIAKPWSGRVTNEGKPVSGALVSVFTRSQKPLVECPPSPRKGDPLGTCLCPSQRERFTQVALEGLPSAVPVASTTTAADGTFSVSLDGDGPFVAQVSTADRRLAVQAPLSEDSAELALQPAVVAKIGITGLKTEVAAYLVNQQTGEVARFTQDGSEWISPPVSAGLRTLVVVGKGATPHREPMTDGRLFSRMLRGGLKENTVTLSAPRSLRGVVTEKGRAIAGAELVADADTCALKAKTNAHGEFSIPAPISAPFLTNLTARSGKSVATASGSAERPVELALQPAARLELTFVDPQGKPVAGVEPWLSGQDVPLRPRAPSDAKGAWAFGDLTDAAVELHVDAPWVLMSDSKLIIKGTTRGKAVVARGVSLEGSVVDPQGQPVRGGQVTIYFGDALQTQVTDSMKDALRGVARVTDARGRFTLSGLLPGEYELLVKSPLGELSAPAKVPGQVSLTLTPSPYVIEGDVLTPSGSPVDKSYVIIIRKGEPNNQMGTSSGADGHFRYVAKGPGVYEVSLANNRKDVQLSEVPGGKPLKFVSEPKPGVRGVVVDAQGVPQAGVLVQAVSYNLPQLMMARATRAPLDPTPLVAQARMMRQYDEAITAADGSFALTLAGKLLVFAQAGELASEAVASGPETPARLVLAPRAQATGRVVDWNGRPLESFSIDGVAFDSPDGRFVVRLPAKGAATLRFEALLSTLVTQTVQVPEKPERVELGDIKLARGFTVAGKVLTEDRTRPRFISLEAKSAGVKLEGAGVMSDGTFALKRVPKGKLELTATSEEFGPATVTAEVKEGMPELTLKLRRAARLEVTVLRKEQPVSRVNVEVTGAGGVRRVQSTATDGRVVLEQLGAGSWAVKVGAVSRTVKLEPGKSMKLELEVP